MTSKEFYPCDIRGYYEVDNVRPSCTIDIESLLFVFCEKRY